jgi:hypothetical protein
MLVLSFNFNLKDIIIIKVDTFIAFIILKLKTYLYSSWLNSKASLFITLFIFFFYLINNAEGLINMKV